MANKMSRTQVHLWSSVVKLQWEFFHAKLKCPKCYFVFVTYPVLFFAPAMKSNYFQLMDKRQNERNTPAFSKKSIINGSVSICRIECWLLSLSFICHRISKAPERLSDSSPEETFEDSFATTSFSSRLTPSFTFLATIFWRIQFHPIRKRLSQWPVHCDWVRRRLRDSDGGRGLSHRARAQVHADQWAARDAPQ